MAEPAIATGACPGCGEVTAEARCGHCGVALRPGGFAVEKVVATTPHSRLYRAREASGRVVAVKELLFALVPGAKEVEAFEREAALLRTLQHPRIPRFLASFQEGRGVGTRLYLVQEFVEGASLADLLATHRFDEREAKDVARQVLAVLAFLHELTPTVLHRDVKPANLIRRPDGSIVLVDFGAARDLEGQVTHRATVVGTYGYMPPEQHGGTVDASADLYALGATLVHLLSRRAPADLAEPGSRLDFERHVKVAPPFAKWLARMIAIRRDERFPSARAAAYALDALDAPAPQPRAGLPPALVVGAGVGLVALGVVAALVLARPSPPPPAPTPIAAATAPIESPPVPAPPEPARSEPAPAIEPPPPPAPPRRAKNDPPSEPSKWQRVRPVGESMRGHFLSESWKQPGPWVVGSGSLRLAIESIEVASDAGAQAEVRIRYALAEDPPPPESLKLTLSASAGEAACTVESASLRAVVLRAASRHAAPWPASVRVDRACRSFVLAFESAGAGAVRALVDLEGRAVRPL